MEQINDWCNSMDNSQKHYVEWKKPCTIEYILYESHRYHAEQKKPDKKGETQMIPFMQAK